MLPRYNRERWQTQNRNRQMMFDLSLLLYILTHFVFETPYSHGSRLLILRNTCNGFRLFPASWLLRTGFVFVIIIHLWLINTVSFIGLICMAYSSPVYHHVPFPSTWWSTNLDHLLGLKVNPEINWRSSIRLGFWLLCLLYQFRWPIASWWHNPLAWGGASYCCSPLARLALGLFTELTSL